MVKSTCSPISTPGGPALPFQGWFGARKDEDQPPSVSPRKPGWLGDRSPFLLSGSCLPYRTAQLNCGYSFKSNLKSLKKFPIPPVTPRDSESVSCVWDLGISILKHFLFRFFQYFFTVINSDYMHKYGYIYIHTHIYI